MSDTKTLSVSRTDIIKAGFEQYMEDGGVSHALKIDGNSLVYEAGTPYRTENTIGAYELCNTLNYQRPHPDEVMGELQPNQALQNIDIKPEVEIGRETYELRIHG